MYNFFYETAPLEAEIQTNDARK